MKKLGGRKRRLIQYQSGTCWKGWAQKYGSGVAGLELLADAKDLDESTQGGHRDRKGNLPASEELVRSQ